MRSLFVLSTLEGWPNYLIDLIDGSVDYPIKNNNMFVVVYFIVFILVGSIICINLFIAIISMNFNEAQEKSKNDLISNEQSQWIAIVKLILIYLNDYIILYIHINYINHINHIIFSKNSSGRSRSTLPRSSLLRGSSRPRCFTSFGASTSSW